MGRSSTRKKQRNRRMETLEQEKGVEEINYDEQSDDNGYELTTTEKDPTGQRGLSIPPETRMNEAIHNKLSDEGDGRKTAGQGGTPTWANMFAEQQEEVRYYPPDMINGVCMPRIPKIEVENSLRKWETVAVCKVVGGHPPVEKIETFLRNTWWNKIDKVWKVKPGVFMVKFVLKMHREAAVEKGMLFFENKPVVVKAWEQNMSFDEPESIPLWIQLHGLAVVYWEPSILCRIVSAIGVPLRLDEATLAIDKLKYARVLVEMKLGAAMPDSIPFIDELGVVQHQKINYEWKPVRCRHCKLIGHEEGSCRWLEKDKQKPQKDIRKPQQIYVPVAIKKVADGNKSNAQKGEKEEQKQKEPGGNRKNEGGINSPHSQRPGKEPQEDEEVFDERLFTTVLTGITIRGKEQGERVETRSTKVKNTSKPPDGGGQ